MTELTASVDASLTGIPPGIAARTGLNTLRDFFRRYGFVIAAYIAATFSTSAIFMGDTVDYVESITLWSRGVNHNFWEFAHLLWRPLGWLTSSLLSPITSLFVGPSQRLNVTLTLITISWLAGVVCVVQIHSLARRVSGRTSVANFVAFAFICTQGFLNFAQAGNSYIAGLALLLLGIQILSFPGKLSHAARSVLAGAALAGAVLLWVNYLFAIPAALVAPLFLVAFDRKCMRLVLRTAIVFSLITGLAYAAVIAGMKLHTVDQVRTWIAASSAGTDFSGVKRAIFGLARSFINMGNDGLLFKRYLLHDPYNPVSLRVLIGAALWKLALFYSFAASVVMGLLYSQQGRRILGVLIVNAAVVLGFAILFAGSDIERHLALYPAVFIAMAACLSNRSPRPLKLIVVVFVAVTGVVNVTAMARPVLDRKQESAAARIRMLLPRLDDRTMVFVANWQDELINFSRAYPFHAINRSGHLHVDALVTPGVSGNLYWRATFASRSLSTWRAGGAVWISRRVLSPRPRAEWNWSEGDDRRVSWVDFNTLFSRLDLGESVGDPDGFVRLTHSSKNEQLFKELCAAI